MERKKFAGKRKYAGWKFRMSHNENLGDLHGPPHPSQENEINRFTSG
jgi:hypothetical protein